MLDIRPLHAEFMASSHYSQGVSVRNNLCTFMALCVQYVIIYVAINRRRLPPTRATDLTIHMHGPSGGKYRFSVKSAHFVVDC